MDSVNGEASLLEQSSDSSDQEDDTRFTKLFQCPQTGCSESFYEHELFQHLKLRHRLLEPRGNGQGVFKIRVNYPTTGYDISQNTDSIPPLPEPYEWTAAILNFDGEKFILHIREENERIHMWITWLTDDRRSAYTQRNFYICNMTPLNPTGSRHFGSKATYWRAPIQMTLEQNDTAMLSICRDYIFKQYVYKSVADDAASQKTGRASHSLSIGVNGKPNGDTIRLRYRWQVMIFLESDDLLRRQIPVEGEMLSFCKSLKVWQGIFNKRWQNHHDPKSPSCSQNEARGEDSAQANMGTREEVHDGKLEVTKSEICNDLSDIHKPKIEEPVLDTLELVGMSKTEETNQDYMIYAEEDEKQMKRIHEWQFKMLGGIKSEELIDTNEEKLSEETRSEVGKFSILVVNETFKLEDVREVEQAKLEELTNVPDFKQEKMACNEKVEVEQYPNISERNLNQEINDSQHLFAPELFEELLMKQGIMGERSEEIAQALEHVEYIRNRVLAEIWETGHHMHNDLSEDEIYGEEAIAGIHDELFDDARHELDKGEDIHDVVVVDPIREQVEGDDIQEMLLEEAIYEPEIGYTQEMLLKQAIREQAQGSDVLKMQLDKSVHKQPEGDNTNEILFDEATNEEAEGDGIQRMLLAEAIQDQEHGELIRAIMLDNAMEDLQMVQDSKITKDKFAVDYNIPRNSFIVDLDCEPSSTGVVDTYEDESDSDSRSDITVISVSKPEEMEDFIPVVMACRGLAEGYEIVTTEIAGSSWDLEIGAGAARVKDCGGTALVLSKNSTQSFVDSDYPLNENDLEIMTKLRNAEPLEEDELNVIEKALAIYRNLIEW